MENNKENKVDLKVTQINLASNTAIPTPSFTLKNGKDFIYYGEDNLYPMYLLDVYNNKSNKHKTIIDKKVDMTTGNGFEEVSEAKTKAFLENAFNTKNKDIAYEMKKINTDYEIHNGFSFLVRWNMKGEVAAIEYIPFHKCRLGVNEDEVLVSADWANVRKDINKPKVYSLFNPLTGKKDKEQIFYYIEETAGVDFYTLPYYSSTLRWIEMDSAIADFHLNSINNGFSAGYHINIPQTAANIDETDDIAHTLKKIFSGSSNANKSFITYSVTAEDRVTVEPIEFNTTDERFDLLHSKVQEEIFTGHSVTSPMLFGIRTEGQLGGRTELLESLAIFQSTYIANKQKVLEKALNKVAKAAGVTEELKLAKYSIDFTNIDAEQNNI